MTPPRVRVAIIDSGIHAGHPHVNGIAGGVAFGSDDFVDRIGHGTAVAAVIREKAPSAELFAVKVFDKQLATDVNTLASAIRWCADNGMHLINLSLGTTNAAHQDILQDAVNAALGSAAKVVSAYEWLPGSLPGVLGVVLDWECPREAYRTDTMPDGRIVYRACGYPRPVPGVPPELNLKGISFAVANVTGLLARGILTSS